MNQLITAASMLVATSIVSVGAAIASPLTVSGQPAVWRFGQSRTIQAKPIAQPTLDTQDSKPQAAVDKGEVKSIDEAPAAPISQSNSCRGDAASATPPVVNNPHHLRNVVWRNARMACTR
ncbi:hypothetical protein LEP3755_65330 (plasmid) [Leptolyngbya sp. NIES-3755]|nr:hypothetical protein LEP3755_65330 [Leptolyngbya sp. NIES-3755]